MCLWHKPVNKWHPNTGTPSCPLRFITCVRWSTTNFQVDWWDPPFDASLQSSLMPTGLSRPWYGRRWQLPRPRLRWSHSCKRKRTNNVGAIMRSSRWFSWWLEGRDIHMLICTYVVTCNPAAGQIRNQIRYGYTFRSSDYLLNMSVYSVAIQLP